MSEQMVFVEIRTTIQVSLPETDNDVVITEADGIPTAKARERAINAVIGALPSSVSVYIDGPDEPPTEVYFDFSDNDVEDVSVE